MRAQPSSSLGADGGLRRRSRPRGPRAAADRWPPRSWPVPRATESSRRPRPGRPGCRATASAHVVVTPCAPCERSCSHHNASDSSAGCGGSPGDGMPSMRCSASTVSPPTGPPSGDGATGRSSTRSRRGDPAPTVHDHGALGTAGDPTAVGVSCPPREGGGHGDPAGFGPHREQPCRDRTIVVGERGAVEVHALRMRFEPEHHGAGTVALGGDRLDEVDELVGAHRSAGSTAQRVAATVGGMVGAAGAGGHGILRDDVVGTHGEGPTREVRRPSVASTPAARGTDRGGSLIPGAGRPDRSARVLGRGHRRCGPGHLSWGRTPWRPVARHLITSALPYINGVKHLGNLVGSMLPADVHARYLRAAGHEVLFICATDEHGTPAELAALAAGQDVATYCAEQHDVQRELCERFGLSFDWFGRTSRPQNHELTNHFARRLRAEGFCEIRSTEQVYSLADGRFLPDRYVVGTCPNCGYDRARGDQCENCGKQLDPTELIDARSAVSGSTDLEVRESSHVFLLQSALADRSAIVDRHQGRLAPADPVDRVQVARRGAARPGHHPRPGLGHPGRPRRLPRGRGQGLVRVVRRPHRISGRDPGVGRRRPRAGRLRWRTSSAGGAPTGAPRT